MAGFTFTREADAQDWRLSWRDESAGLKSCIIPAGLEEKGGWFEQLTGWAFARLPEHPFIAVNLSTKRPSMADRKDFNGHLTEVDVIALGRGENYAISCKSGKMNGEATARAALEIRSVAHNFGRYFAPMLCSFYEKEITVVEGVVVFGWPALGNQSELLRAMKKARSLLL